MSLFWGVLQYISVLHSTSVRMIREDNGKSSLGFVTGIAEMAVYSGVIYFAITLLGKRDVALRGDALTFVLTGLAIFIMHKKTLQAVQNAVKSNHNMLLHRPASTTVFIWGGAIGRFYNTAMMIVIVFAAKYFLTGVFDINNVFGCISMLLLAWLLGIGVGMIFHYVHYYVSWIGIFSRAWARTMLWTSGLFFAANNIPRMYLPYLDWNPMLHIIDQSRGYAFVNYTPHNTTLTYPIVVTAIVFLIGRFLEARLSSVMTKSKLSKVHA